MIGPAIGADRAVAAVVIAAVDQKTADAGRAQFAERLLRLGHGGLYLRTLFLRTAVLDRLLGLDGWVPSGISVLYNLGEQPIQLSLKLSPARWRDTRSRGAGCCGRPGSARRL